MSNFADAWFFTTPQSTGAVDELMWIEDPVPITNPDACAEVRELVGEGPHVPIRVALARRLPGEAGYQRSSQPPRWRRRATYCMHEW